MRPIALNRKNALFAGHDAGAENWACLASLIETCKLNGIDPQAYLTDVLTRLVNLWLAARIDELLPWAWTGASLTACGDSAPRRGIVESRKVFRKSRDDLARMSRLGSVPSRARDPV